MIGLVVLAGVVFVYSLFAFFIIYHLDRFGVGPAPKVAAFVFFIGSMLLLFLVVVTFFSIDFSILKRIYPASY